MDFLPLVFYDHLVGIIRTAPLNKLSRCHRTAPTHNALKQLKGGFIKNCVEKIERERVCLSISVIVENGKLFYGSFVQNCASGQISFSPNLEELISKPDLINLFHVSFRNSFIDLNSSLFTQTNVEFFRKLFAKLKYLRTAVDIQSTNMGANVAVSQFPADLMTLLPMDWMRQSQSLRIICCELDEIFENFIVDSFANGKLENLSFLKKDHRSAVLKTDSAYIARFLNVWRESIAHASPVKILDFDETSQVERLYAEMEEFPTDELKAHVVWNALKGHIKSHSNFTIAKAHRLSHPTVEGAFAFLLTFVQSDGGTYIVLIMI